MVIILLQKNQKCKVSMEYVSININTISFASTLCFHASGPHMGGCPELDTKNFL